METDDKGITIELASSAFYKPGSADFRQEAIIVLEKISEMLIAPKYMAYYVEVEGHTDDDPINTARFPSNWELSTGRSTTVVRYFIGQGMDFRRLSAKGFAETRPKVPNRDEEGNPIPENQMENRRVVINVNPMPLQDRAQIFGDATYGLVEQTLEGEAPPPVEPADPGTVTGLQKVE